MNKHTVDSGNSTEKEKVIKAEVYLYALFSREKFIKTYDLMEWFKLSWFIATFKQNVNEP